MHGVARKFRYYIVEARFVSLAASLSAIVMRGAMFLVIGVPETKIPDGGFVWKYLSPFFADPRVSFVFSTAAVFFIAWLLSHLNHRFSLLRSRTNLPFIVPLFLFSLHPYFLLFTTDYVSVIFIVFAFFPLLSSYQKYDAQAYSFKSAILIALAGLFQVYALFLLPLFWMGESSMRGMHAKSLLSSLLGLLMVYWSAFGAFFFFDDLDGFVIPFRNLVGISLPEMPLPSARQWILAALISLFFIGYAIVVPRTYYREKVLAQITLRLLMLIPFALFALQVLYWGRTFFLLILGLALFSFPIAYFYSTTVSKWAIRSFFIVSFILGLFYFFNYFSILPFPI